MLAKVWTVAVAAAFASVLALPAPAANAQTTPPAAAAKPMAKPMTMKKSAKHKMDCYDYAYQSAAMNDCLAKQGTSSSGDGMTKPMKKSKKKKMS